MKKILLGLVALALTFDFFVPGQDVEAQSVVPSITSLLTGQVVQEVGAVGAGTCTFTVAGSVGSGTHTIEARYSTGTWTTMQVNAVGTYSGTLTNVPVGTYQLIARWADNINIYTVTERVKCGELFVIAGQSNAVGQGTSLQAYTAIGFMIVSAFKGDYLWHEKILEPFGLIWKRNNLNWVDNVNNNGTTGNGSIWPEFVTKWYANAATQNVPLGFITCATNGTSSANWLPAADHQDRTTTYGACNYRVLQVTTSVRAWLWWQGETDAALSVSQATYTANLTTIGNAIFADEGGAILMPAKLEDINGCGGFPTWAQIQAAQVASWNTGHIGTGPDLSAIVVDDCAPHIIGSGKLTTAGDTTFTASKTQFGF